VSKLAMESEEFAQFLRDPTVPLKQKSTVLQEVLSSVKVNDLTKNFFSAAPPPPASPGAPQGEHRACLQRWLHSVCARGSGAGGEQPPQSL